MESQLENGGSALTAYIYIYIGKTRENFIFLRKGKMVISVIIRDFSRSRMTKRTSPLESF